MKKLILLGIAFTCFFANAQIITNPQTLADVKSMLAQQKELAKNRNKELFSVFDKNLTTDERQALEFLYAYMPLSDLADCDGDYFLRQVRATLKARDEMPWVKTLPESAFLHFVLPIRVNNENLDEFRAVAYDELKYRVRGLSMEEAALEVNHWCHEKVNYRGSDARTSSPLQSIRTSWGRCGEESTFTVSALRMVGIPARQVYTPRWAHCDDNHAWVEVFVNEKWQYLGACEPDAKLDMGWFTEPARRTMLVNTRAYGKYSGNEEVLRNEARFSELNVVANYTQTKRITVKVLDAKGRPAVGADLEFGLYNYAEFYPLFKTKTDEKGEASFTTGYGDLMLWAYQNDAWAYQKISVANAASATLKLSNKFPNNHFETFDWHVPVEQTPYADRLTPAEKAENTARMHFEDSIRGLYMASFKDSLWCTAFVRENNYKNADRLVPLLLLCYGNWAEITQFLSSKPENQKEWAVELLSQISEKDIRDTKASILEDHLRNSFQYAAGLEKSNQELFSKFVLNPRVGDEKLIAYKAYLQNAFGDEFIQSVRKDVNQLIQWMTQNMTTNQTANLHSRAPLTPQGVYELRAADKISYQTFFVAACRSFGIPSRINEASQMAQVYENGSWKNIAFEPTNENINDKGFVNLICDTPEEAKYSITYSLARFQNGRFETVGLEWGKEMSGKTEKIELETGKYFLLTGTRQSNGDVLGSLYFFEINKGKITDAKIVLRQPAVVAKSTIGKIDLKRSSIAFYSQQVTKPDYLENHISEQGAILIWIEPDKEPSKHVMADLPLVKEQLEKWGGNIIFMLSRETTSQSFNPDHFKNLPEQSVYCWDVGNSTLAQVAKMKKREQFNNLPVITVIDKDGNVSFFNEGYTIGIGDKLLKEIK